MNDVELNELWGTCIFVFDANTLLNLYRYSKDSRNLLLQIMEHVADRIWIPYQIAWEYHKNLGEIIHKQENEYDRIAQTVDNAVQSLNNGLVSLRHSNIEINKITELFNQLGLDVRKELDVQKENQPNLDELKNQLNILIGNKVGRFYSQDELDKIYADGKSRYERQIPPGFEDLKEKKDQKSYLNGIVYQDAFGDLVFWNQLLEKAKEESVKSVILISDDTKKDWILEMGGKKKGPLPSLVQEFRKETNNKMFYMYNSERFLKQAERYLNFGSESESVKENIDLAIKEIEETKRTINNSLNRKLDHLRELGMLPLFKYKVIISKKNAMFSTGKIISFFVRDVSHLCGTEVEIDDFIESNSVVILHITSEESLNIPDILNHYIGNKDGNFFVFDMGTCDW
ncbi:PIN-like domain-containing protein [Paenibacillus sp. FSL F4-0243]|uniref:PIN-like domain-containing protein n=1 Tax=Paenibacillus sp. FSL F4-0243 TaxID=2954732 RepID=UPI0030D9CBC4